MATAVTGAPASRGEMSREDETLLILARLMEGGQEDDETIRDLDQLTKLLNQDSQINQASSKGPAASSTGSSPSICAVLDADCVDTMLSYLDMRQPDAVRGHAVLTTAAYLKAAGEDGANKLSSFFLDRVRRGTYDDYILAFCVAASTFPIVPDLTASLFLAEGFLASLGPLMRRKWKSRKVETACLDMLNAACINSACRDAVLKYCADWLEEVVDQDPAQVAHEFMTQDPDSSGASSVTMRRHSEAVQNLAAVILAKLRAMPPSTASLENQTSSSQNELSQSHERITPAVTSLDDLSSRFTDMLLKDDDNHDTHHSIEGLAYASLQPSVREDLARNKAALAKLVKTLSDAQAKSPLTYGALTILVNLTRYQPALSEEQKKKHQLKAYANAAAPKTQPDPLVDDKHVAERCKLVFDAGVTPVLVSRSKFVSPASLALIVSIIYSLSVTPSLRGQLAQQGAVKLLLSAWHALPESDTAARRTAAQALARILISTNPALVFGGSRSHPQSSAIRPLLSILPPDPAADTRDLLPTFESLMALTNLASTDDADTRRAVVRTAWPHVEEQLLSSNALVSKAAAELVCNLVQSPEGMALYADGSPAAGNRLHVLLALADAEGEGTRSAAGGALAALTGHPDVVRAIVGRDRGVEIVLGMCGEESEDMRHRGGFVVYNMVVAEGEAGVMARKKILERDGLEVLKKAAKRSRRAEVVEVIVETLKVLLEGDGGGGGGSGS